MTGMIDWTTEYDIFSKEYIENPFPIWDDLREGCPIAHSDKWGGSWLPTTYEDVTAIARDPQRFSSREIIVVPPAEAPGSGAYGPSPAAPISVDAPMHTWTRRQILPAFAPRAVDELEVFTRAWCRELMDVLAHKKEADIAVEYAQQIPAQVIANMLGVPTNMKDQFTTWVRNSLEAGLTDPELRIKTRRELQDFFMGEIIKRRATGSTDDLIGELVHAQHDGEHFPDGLILGMCGLLLIAGVDTTWSGIGSSLWHLASNPIDRRRLVENPEKISMAVEEFLRAYAPVTMARMVTDDMEFHGVQMKKEDRVLLPFPAANRDENQFADPAIVDIEREENRHAAFGLGIHRCIGSNLARLEMNVAIEVFLKRFPDFELETSEQVTWSTGQVRGPRNLPFRINVRA